MRLGPFLLLGAALVLGAPCARAADQLSIFLPKPGLLGEGWVLSVGIDLADLDHIPAPVGKSEGAEFAREMIDLMVTTLKPQKVVSALSATYEPPQKGGLGLEVHCYRFLADADCAAYYTKAAKKTDEVIAVGTAGRISTGLLGKVLTFERGPYLVKISELDPKSDVEKLARLIDAKLPKP